MRLLSVGPSSEATCPDIVQGAAAREVRGLGWLKGLEVTTGGSGVVSHAGLALLRAPADSIGLTAGLTGALASPRRSPAPGGAVAPARPRPWRHGPRTRPVGHPDQ